MSILITLSILLIIYGTFLIGVITGICSLVKQIPKEYSVYLKTRWWGKVDFKLGRKCKDCGDIYYD